MRIMKKIILGLACSIVGALLTTHASAVTLTEVTTFGSNPGNLRMFHYVPANRPAGAPLVIVAHGCAGSAQDMADTSGWVELADRYKFALVFPQTSTANEPLGGCFRTWLADHQQRDAGEPLSVRQMASTMQSQFNLSATAVFMTGMSSGGHLTNVMMATYPDMLAAAAPQSSFPYKCAMASSELAVCSQAGRNYTAQQWGDLARSGYPGYNGPRPKVQIWHGSADTLIYLPDQYQQVMQWTNANAIDAVVDWSDYLLGQPRNTYNTFTGVTRVQTVTVQGMGHAIAVDPGFGAWQCGATGTYAADFNICAAYWIANFFGITY
jgi:poly(hydroxyalkanoate) depolymerase family esterase